MTEHLIGRAAATMTLFLVLCACGASTPVPQNSAISMLSCEDLLHRGKELERLHANAQALEVYAPCVDELIPAVALLGKRYSAARRLLERRRQELNAHVEQAALSTKEPNRKNIELLIEYNAALDYQAQNLVLFDRLNGNPSFAQTTRIANELLWKDLVMARRYVDALRVEEAIKAEIQAWLVVSKENPVGPSLNEYAVRSAALYTEALAGTGQGAAARSLFEEVATHNPSATTYSIFIEHAVRGGQPQLASMVREEARVRLSSDEMVKVDEVFRRYFDAKAH